MNENTSYLVNGPGVVSEVIDGELVIMNLQSGHYFSAEHTGAAVWGWIEAGHDVATIVSLVTSHYTGGQTVREDIISFVEKLLEHELLVIYDGADRNVDPAASAGHKKPYSKPDIAIYTDMKDMLVLDPIHDVDEAGWPMPKADSEAG